MTHTCDSETLDSDAVSTADAPGVAAACPLDVSVNKIGIVCCISLIVRLFK